MDIWRTSELPEVQRASAWAISSIPIIDRDLNPFGQLGGDLIEFIKPLGSLDKKEVRNEYDFAASVIVAFDCKSPWSDNELVSMAAKTQKEAGPWIPRYEELLKALGESGEAELERLEEKGESRKTKKRKANKG